MTSMRSLQSRLIAAVLLVVFLFWAAWLGFQATLRSRDNTGLWDATLSEIAKEILLSLPSNLEDVAGRPTLALPPSASFKGEMASYQVWVRREQSALRSPGAPAMPLQPDFRDGFSNETQGGEDWRVYAITDSTGAVQVQIGKRYAVLHEELSRWTRLSLVTATLVFALLGITVWATVRWTLAPVAQVRRTILSREGLNMQPLPTHGLPREIEPLVDAFNRLLAELDTAVQAERRFIADAAHELRTPLAALLNHAQVALGAADSASQRSALLRLKAVAERGARLSEQLLDLARLDSWRPDDSRAPVDLVELVLLVLRDFESAASHKRQQVTLEAQPCPMRGHVDGLGILIRNLIDNAVRYTPEGGRIVVQCGLDDDTGAPWLRVADEGPGVPIDERERIFERFYRVPGNGSPGSGIGLSLVSRIARLHGASIVVGDGLQGRGLGILLSFAAEAAPHQNR